MFLHLGQDVVIREEDIIGVFDIENTTAYKDTRLFLKAAEKAGKVVNVSLEMPKSFCVCQNKKTGEQTVYLSQLAPATLEKRQGVHHLI